MVQNDNDTPLYLFTVEYDEEAERKRVEYLFSNWDSGQITAPNGLVRIAEDINREELHEQLLTKVPEEQVDVYDRDGHRDRTRGCRTGDHSLTRRCRDVSRLRLLEKESGAPVEFT